MIHLNDVRSYNSQYEAGFVEDTLSVLRSGQYILGPAVKEFEEKVAGYIGVSHCAGVSSGTSALEVMFECLNLTENDEIVIQANAYIACAFGAIRSKASLCIIDCEPDGTFSIDNLVNAITPKTRAVLVVHLYGDCCDMERLADVCSTRNILLVEDCAQSFGSEYAGKKLGSFGYASCHSFYPTKNLGALGDAGAICTNDLVLFERILKVRNLGSTKKYYHSVMGTNARLDTLQASYLLRKFPDLDGSINAKRQIASVYQAELNATHLKNPDPRVKSSYHLYVIVVKNRDRFVDYMKMNDIETIIHYPIPFYKSEAFSHYNQLSFPNAELLSHSIVSIPIHPLLTGDQVRKIVLKTNEFVIQ
jgi:dTDP-4-amino-4,6-dideoxygalactose transaminase